MYVSFQQQEEEEKKNNKNQRRRKIKSNKRNTQHEKKKERIVYTVHSALELVLRTESNMAVPCYIINLFRI